MGLGNHKRKMSISLSITLIFPHTDANLVQMRGRERKSTTARDVRPLALDSQVTRLQGFSSKACLIGKDRVLFDPPPSIYFLF